MLLPILIFSTDVKKNSDNSVNLVNKQKLAKRLWILMNTTAAQLFLLALITTIGAKIYHLLRWLPPNLNENLTLEYCYPFAAHKQRQQDFFLQMDKVEQDALLQKLKFNYQEILIIYFTRDKTLKLKIDQFVNAVFCANIPVPQIIEIHMEVIEEFSKQLRLEGRSDETLLDYRLTLIDILANLCEAYRVSLYK
jgi:circadian clock protein KaiA